MDLSSVFLHYCNFPRVCFIISNMLNRIFFIKLVHTFIFVFMAACLAFILYSGITRTFNWVLLLALIAILVEGIALLFNKGRCPLTSLAERCGAEKGTITDLFLPKVIARNIFKVSLWLFIAELGLLSIRYFIGWLVVLLCKIIVGFLPLWGVGAWFRADIKCAG